jgi:hypothetical protein
MLPVGVNDNAKFGFTCMTDTARPGDRRLFLPKPVKPFNNQFFFSTLGSALR